MSRLRPYSVAVFCAVTLLIWANRIWLAWTNDGDTVARKVLWSLPITVFVVLAVVVGVAMLVGVDRAATWFVRSVQVFAAGTIAFWVIRAPMIIAATQDVENPTAFKVVHTVLALISIVPAVFAWRAVSSPARTAAAA